MSHFDFTPPEFWNFPPFFTLQPVETTRRKQLALWRELILGFHMATNQHGMTLAEFPYFENKSIGRKLDSSAKEAVIEYLISSGNAEWEDNEHSRARIMWKTSEALAADIYAWAKSNFYIGNIFTVFELLSGEEYKDSGTVNNCILREYFEPLHSGFYECDPVVFKKALVALEKQNKCVLIEGDTSEEDGVKFT